MLKILIVDDDLAVATSLARGLRKHEPAVETDPMVARARLLAGEWYDVVLCDVNMPGFSGLRLRSVACELPEQPIFLLMSGSDDIEDVGADFVLHKPFKIDYVVNILAVLARRKAQSATRPLARMQNVSSVAA